MIIVKEEDALKRVNSPDNLLNKLLEIKDLHSGRTGPKNIPPMVKDLIGVTAALTTCREASESVDKQVNVSTAFKYRNDVREKKDSKLTEVHNLALDAMINSIKALNDLPVKKATDASRIAADMARVVDKTSPREAGNTNIQVVMFAPRQKDETEFETIEVA
jgi:hypothetical protein